MFDVTLVATDNYGRSVTKTKKNLISVTPSIPQPNFTSNIQEFTLTGSFEARRVEFDGNKFIIESDGQPRGLTSNQFYTFVLSPVD